MRKAIILTADEAERTVLEADEPAGYSFNSRRNWTNLSRKLSSSNLGEDGWR